MVIKIYLHRNGRNDGPYSEESIREHLKSGKVEKDDWAWAKSQEQWVRLSDLVDVGEGQEQVAINPKELTNEQVLEYSEKIKKLIASDQEDLATDLVRSLASPRLYEELLKDCSIDEDGIPKLPDLLRGDEGYLSMQFFLKLIAHCPKESQIDQSLKRESITQLNLKSCNSLNNLDGLSNLTNLTQLWLVGCESLTNVDGLSNLTNLTSLNLSG